MKNLNQKYHFIAGLHGNEPILLFALSEAKIDFMVGNPKALAQTKRYIDEDLNKSFGLEGTTYERKRAKALLDLISTGKTVIDFHTYSAKTEPFSIIVNTSMIGLCQKTGLSKVVFMKFNIKDGHALINYRDGISVEVGNHETESAYKTTRKVLDNLEKDTVHQVQIYEVYGIIDKPGSYKNFELYNNDFYPVLAGSKAYSFYGLKTRLKHTISH